MIFSEEVAHYMGQQGIPNTVTTTVNYETTLNTSVVTSLTLGSVTILPQIYAITSILLENISSTLTSANIRDETVMGKTELLPLIKESIYDKARRNITALNMENRNPMTISLDAPSIYGKINCSDSCQNKFTNRSSIAKHSKANSVGVNSIYIFPYNIYMKKYKSRINGRNQSVPINNSNRIKIINYDYLENNYHPENRPGDRPEDIPRIISSDNSPLGSIPTIGSSSIGFNQGKNVTPFRDEKDDTVHSSIEELNDAPFIFDRTVIKSMLIALYSTVFVTGLVGKCVWFG